MIKLSISNLAWDSKFNEEVYSLMQKYGFTGLEIAPTKIFPENPYSHLKEASEWACKLYSEYGFSIPSMQSIWYGRVEKLFGSQEERLILTNYTKSAIDFAEVIGCKNLVFGCPKNRIISDESDIDIASQFFYEIGEYALSKKTCIGMEANPVIYGTNFINTTVQAIDLIRNVNSLGFKLNLDLGTMIENNESIEILENNADIINHVHISEPYLKKIVLRDLHNELISYLVENDYNGSVSIEMGLQENLSIIEEVLLCVRNLINE